MAAAAAAVDAETGLPFPSSESSDPRDRQGRRLRRDIFRLDVSADDDAAMDPATEALLRDGRCGGPGGAASQPEAKRPGSCTANFSS